MEKEQKQFILLHKNIKGPLYTSRFGFNSLAAVSPAFLQTSFKYAYKSVCARSTPLLMIWKKDKLFFCGSYYVNGQDLQYIFEML